MCGILLAIGAVAPAAREACLAALAARGPEFAALRELCGALWGFTRLAINGLSARGHQPIVTGANATICNGEIYNYVALAASLDIVLDAAASDCGVLPSLFARLPPLDACRALDGVFALAVGDAAAGTAVVARDPYGVRPLFWARAAASERVLGFASELKALLPLGADAVLAPFPPGHWWRVDLATGARLGGGRYHETPWLKVPLLEAEAAAAEALRTALVQAVSKRLMSDRAVGATLSGGLDSSLVCAIAARALAAKGARLATFCVGMAGSTDLAYARSVATHIGSAHHEVLLTPDAFFAAIPEVVAATETYDTTSVRASVGNYLVARYIRANTDIKVVLNGDGSDEAGGGYLYFKRAPSDAEFEAESGRLLDDIHLFDVLRSDRSVAAHGLEARTPFLDRQVVATWRAIATRLRRPTASQPEKAILRQAFAEGGWLPAAVLWRQKEAFSDGVSAAETPWHASIDGWARAWLRERGTDVAAALAGAAAAWPHNPPRTPEAVVYRTLFDAAFGAARAQVIPYMWMPRWSPEATDPSARTLSLYAAPAATTTAAASATDATPPPA